MKVALTHSIPWCATDAGRVKDSIAGDNLFHRTHGTLMPSGPASAAIAPDDLISVGRAGDSNGDDRR